MPDRKQPPHHRLTLKDVVKDYQSGLITAKGAVFYAVAASRRLGEPIQIDPDQFCKHLGMHKATMYRAISFLKIQKRLDWSVQGKISLWVPTRETSENTRVPEYIFLGELSQNCDSQSQIGDKLSQNCDSQSQIGDKIAPEIQTQQGLQPPFLSLLFIQSLLSSTEWTESEVLEFRDWLHRRLEELPIRPAFSELWIEKQASKQAVQNEFRRYLKSKQSRPTPGFSMANENFADGGDRDSRLAVLRRWWNQGKQDQVRQWLTDNPDQGIDLSEVES